MQKVPIRFENGLLIASLQKNDWIIDTGAPVSFGAPHSLNIDETTFQVRSTFLGHTPASLSENTGVNVAGIIGVDVLNNFDVILDLDAGSLLVSQHGLSMDGTRIKVNTSMGSPIVSTTIKDRHCRLFFDTGSKYSYLQTADREQFPDAGWITDFYPGFGQFQSDARRITLTLADMTLTLCCGRLPNLLALALSAGGTEGIIGNEVLKKFRIGYFPRQNHLLFQSSRTSRIESFEQ